MDLHSFLINLRHWIIKMISNWWCVCGDHMIIIIYSFLKRLMILASILFYPAKYRYVYDLGSFFLCSIPLYWLRNPKGQHKLWRVKIVKRICCYWPLSFYYSHCRRRCCLTSILNFIYWLFWLVLQWLLNTKGSLILASTNLSVLSIVVRSNDSSYPPLILIN